MRYALRNQQKIAKAMSEDQLNLILHSLKAHFSTHEEITAVRIPEEPYEVLTIDVFGNENGKITFYVIGVQYDVYRLALKGFLNIQI